MKLDSRFWLDRQGIGLKVVDHLDTSHLLLEKSSAISTWKHKVMDRGQGHWELSDPEEPTDVEPLLVLIQSWE